MSPFVIRVPALRDRQEDLELLVAHFMQRIAHVTSAQEGQGPPRVSGTAMQLLKDYEWPGNIAELKSVLQGVLMESRGAVLATYALNRFLDVRRAEALKPDEKTLDSQWRNNADHSHTPSNQKPDSDNTWDLRAFVDQQIANGTERLYEQAIELLDEQLLSLVLQHTHGNRVKASKLLGITRTSLRRKMNGGLPEEPRVDDENA